MTKFFETENAQKCFENWEQINRDELTREKVNHPEIDYDVFAQKVYTGHIKLTQSARK